MHSQYILNDFALEANFRGGGKIANTVFKYLPSAGILDQSIGARNLVEIGLSYRHARIHRLAGLLKSLKISSQATKAGESIPGPFKSLKIRLRSLH
jgi:hypothetical protein